MNSPFGQRGEICSKFGWSWKYLHEEIPWFTVIRIMADSCWFDDAKETNPDDTADEIDCENLTEEAIAKLKNLAFKHH